MRPAPTSDQSEHFHARTHFRRKEVLFQWEARIRGIKKGHLSVRRPRNFEKGLRFCVYLHVFIPIFTWS